MFCQSKTKCPFFLINCRVFPEVWRVATLPTWTVFCQVFPLSNWAIKRRWKISDFCWATETCLVTVTERQSKYLSKSVVSRNVTLWRWIEVVRFRLTNYLSAYEFLRQKPNRSADIQENVSLRLELEVSGIFLLQKTRFGIWFLQMHNTKMEALIQQCVFRFRESVS